MLARRLRRCIRRLSGGEHSPRRARLFVKDECGLCEQARELLRPFERSGAVEVQLVDIAADEDVFKRYCFSIPVLEVDGRPTLAWPFGREELRRALA